MVIALLLRAHVHPVLASVPGIFVNILRLSQYLSASPSDASSFLFMQLFSCRAGLSVTGKLGASWFRSRDGGLLAEQR